jgi:hypothetical protein
MSCRYSDLSNLFIMDMFIMDMCRYGAQHRDATLVSARIAWLRQGRC